MSNITQFTTGGVKSIQSGIYTVLTGGTPNFTITISTVNPVKCMVILNGGYQYSQDNVLSQLVSLTATVLTVRGPYWYYSGGGGWQGSQATWQIVEYY